MSWESQRIRAPKAYAMKFVVIFCHLIDVVAEAFCFGVELTFTFCLVVDVNSHDSDPFTSSPPHPRSGSNDPGCVGGAA